MVIHESHCKAHWCLILPHPAALIDLTLPHHGFLLFSHPGTDHLEARLLLRAPWCSVIMHICHRTDFKITAALAALRKESKHHLPTLACALHLITAQNLVASYPVISHHHHLQILNRPVIPCRFANAFPAELFIPHRLHTLYRCNRKKMWHSNHHYHHFYVCDQASGINA